MMKAAILWHHQIVQIGGLIWIHSWIENFDKWDKESQNFNASEFLKLIYIYAVIHYVISFITNWYYLQLLKDKSMNKLKLYCFWHPILLLSLIK